jgi:hypothetical protein
MKFLILGHKEHGKTTVGNILNNKFGLKAMDSSMEAAKIFIYDALKDKYNYKSFEECYSDRRQRRKEWYELITEYNKDNRSRLAEAIMEYNDIYMGMRDFNEIKICKEKNLFDLIVGVFDPSKPLESSDSFNIDLFVESDIIIYNDSSIFTENDLEEKIIRIFSNML